MLHRATVRNVNRALKGACPCMFQAGVNSFQWEGEFKPLARKAL